MQAWAEQAGRLRVRATRGAGQAAGREGAGRRAGKGEGRSGPPSGGPVRRKEEKEGGEGTGPAKTCAGLVPRLGQKGQKRIFFK